MTMNSRHSRGFTLVECMVVIVLMGIAAVGIGKFQGNLFSKQTTVASVQVQQQLQMECAESILATRKYQKGGYDSITTGSTPSASLTALTGYSVASVTVTDPYSGTACPNTNNCKLVEIT